VLDANGNATGGVRSPHVDVPVATIRGTGQPPSNLFCSLFGTTAPFSDATLDTLYVTQEDLWAAWNAAVDNAVANGFVLAADEPKLKSLPEPVVMLSIAVGLLALAGLRWIRGSGAV
jgi:hypothetical protein